jgi:hypothetical protein
MRSNIDPPSPSIKWVALSRALAFCAPILLAAARPGARAAQESLTIAITIEATRQAIRIAMVTTQIRGMARS